MPSWTQKERRQFDHIKESQKDRGRSDRRAAEVAGRTVNKQRRLKGVSPSSRAQGTGNPSVALQNRTVHELRNLAARKNI